MTFARLGKPLYLTLGWTSVGLGFMGVIMPILPTTPFLIVALWAFSRSSPELAAKIRSNRFLGPYIRDWEEAGVIPLKAKVLAVAMMAAMFAYLAFVADLPAWAVAIAGAVLLAIAIFVVSRPSRRR